MGPSGNLLRLSIFPFADHLEELEQLLKGIAMMKELTPRTKDYLVSFGECMSTRIFAAYLNKIGAKARQVSYLHPTIFFFYIIAIQMKLVSLHIKIPHTILLF